MNCPDPKLKDVAARDISNPKDAAGQFALGNSWWELAQKQSGYSRTRFQMRAAHWYRQAVGSLGELEKGLAEKRMAASAGAPAEATTFGGHAYLYDATVMTWHEAKLACELAGGHLMCVESEKEHLFIVDLLAKRRSWLGASDEKEEGQWLWVNGSPFKFSAWRGGEPNNADGNENCLLLNEGGKWFDVPNRTSKGTGFVCEWE
jgi:CD209 antigen